MAPTNGYAAVADVQALLQSYSVAGTGITIGAGSAPTTTQVEGFLDQVAYEVESVLSALGYTTPVTGTRDVIMLRRYIAQKAAAKTYDAGYGGFDEPPSRIKRWHDEYDDFLAALRDKEISLLDAGTASTTRVVHLARYVGD